MLRVLAEDDTPYTAGTTDYIEVSNSGYLLGILSIIMAVLLL
jgi:hypothetical protein